jgi:hypothetical protein
VSRDGGGGPKNKISHLFFNRCRIILTCSLKIIAFKEDWTEILSF